MNILKIVFLILGLLVGCSFEFQLKIDHIVNLDQSICSTPDCVGPASACKTSFWRGSGPDSLNVWMNCPASATNSKSSLWFVDFQTKITQEYSQSSMVTLAGGALTTAPRLQFLYYPLNDKPSLVYSAQKYTLTGRTDQLAEPVFLPVHGSEGTLLLEVMPQLQQSGQKAASIRLVLVDRVAHKPNRRVEELALIAFSGRTQIEMGCLLDIFARFQGFGVHVSWMFSDSTQKGQLAILCQNKDKLSDILIAWMHFDRDSGVLSKSHRIEEISSSDQSQQSSEIFQIEIVDEPNVGLIHFWDGSMLVKYWGDDPAFDKFEIQRLNHNKSGNPGTKFRTFCIQTDENTITLISSSMESKALILRVIDLKDNQNQVLFDVPSTAAFSPVGYSRAANTLLLQSRTQLAAGRLLLDRTGLEALLLRTTRPGERTLLCRVAADWARRYTGDGGQGLLSGCPESETVPKSVGQDKCSSLVSLNECLNRFDCIGVTSAKNTSCFSLTTEYKEKIFPPGAVLPEKGLGRSAFEYLAIKYKTVQVVSQIVDEAASSETGDQGSSSDSDDDESGNSIEFKLLPDDSRVFYNNSRGLSIQTQVFNKPKRS